ncbi:MAG: HEPN domain-containing protein [Acidobacteria bacterium]|nr:HEPN domain-containing protein [Acidobacteriota bacterium]
MKPPDEVRQELVQKWFTKAEEDLAVANQLLADDVPYYAAIGFHAQQAAEKFIKAFWSPSNSIFRRRTTLGC